MVYSDFLSRMEGDNNDPHELISIPSNSYSNLDSTSETYRVVTGSQTKAVGTQIPKVHGAD